LALAETVNLDLTLTVTLSFQNLISNSLVNSLPTSQIARKSTYDVRGTLFTADRRRSKPVANSECDKLSQLYTVIED